MSPDQKRTAALPSPAFLFKKETAETDTIASTSVHSVQSILAGDIPLSSLDISPASDRSLDVSDSGANRTDDKPQTTTSVDPTPQDSLTDVERIRRADFLAKEEQVFGAARLLRRVSDVSLLTVEHKALLNLAQDVEDAIQDLVGDVPPGWKRQSEVHGKHDTLIHYIVDEDARLTCRLETLIEPSLLVPFLSVLNESELYPDWIPSWKVPRMGFDSVQILDKQNRANQILQVVTVSPWPFSNREVIIQATALDDIDAQGFIGIRLNTLDGGDVVPPATPGVERVDFDGAFLFRACPADHPVLLKSTKQYDDEPILVTFKMYVDAKMRGLPTWVINFITRNAVGQIWSTLLKVAEDVRDGKRPNHKSRIDAQAEFYGWVQSRIDAMFAKLRQDGQDQKFVAYLQS
jgi:hypothetical protein